MWSSTTSDSVRCWARTGCEDSALEHQEEPVLTRAEHVHERLLSSCFSVILVVIGPFRVWGLKSDPWSVRRLSNFRWVWARPADGRWRLMDGARLRLSQMTSWFQAILKLTAVTLRLGMRRGCPLLSCLLLLLSPPIPSHPLLPLHHLHRLLPLFSFIASLLSFTPFTFWPVLLYFLFSFSLCRFYSCSLRKTWLLYYLKEVTLGKCCSAVSK